MIHHRLPRALLGLLILLTAPAPLLAADEVFSVRVPVESQQPEARDQAMIQAMAQVLVRATGNDEVVQSPSVAPLLEQPSRFLQRYQYESRPGQQLMLTFQFDGPSLKRALAAHGVPTWAADRPPVLVWLAAEQGGRRLLVGGEDGTDIRAQLQEAAAARGLLLLFPLMDGEDQRQVSYADVFGGFTDRVRAAAGRYGATVMVIGRLYRDGETWIGRWSLSGMGESSWTTSGGSRAEVLDAAAADLAARIGTRYAELAGQRAVDQRLVLRVVDVDTLREYDRLERHLRSLAGVTQVRPLLVEPAAVVMQLALQGQPERVLAALRGDRLLAPVATAESPDEPQGFQEPVFRLTP